MHYLLLALSTLWMWQIAAATLASTNLPELEPIFNNDWRKSLQLRDRKRDSVYSHLDLQDKEQFLWGSPNSSNQSTVFSMMVYTKDEELVISMERFARELKAVNCSQNMWLTFKSNAPFQYVMSTWNWVNINGTRSFIMVANYPGCGKDGSREPWVVSNAHFDNFTLTVRLDATKRTWKEVLHTYDMDFGDFIPPSTNKRRFLDVNLDKSFTVDLSSKLPTELFKATTPNNISLAIDCTDCGTKGTLVFAGHISASLFDGITAIELSATPHGIEADLKLSVQLIGSLSFEVADVLQLNKRLLTLPIPSGFSIPGVLTFGPNVDINAGLSLDSLEGEAMITTGITAKIPDSAVAKVDLLGKKAVDISGWVPQFTTDPIVVQAEVDAEVELYTELAVAVSLLVLDDDGFNVDLGLRVPDVHLTAVTEYDPSGVCPGSSQPVGVTVDAQIGVELVLEGFTEASGVEHSFLNVPLFNDSSIFTFPPLCIPFGSVTGVCLYTPQSPHDAAYEASEDTGGVDKRSELMPRAPDKKRRPYWITCDTAKTEIRVQEYPKPNAIKKPNSKYDVPIMKPGIEQCQEHPSCPEADWTVTRGSKADLSTGNWATEHVYEGNWIKQYLDYLQDKFFKNSFGTPQIDCENEVYVFGKVPVSITTPDPQGPSNYSEALMQNLGTIYTAGALPDTTNVRLAVFPQEQNQVKNLVFAGFDLYGDFTKATTTNEERVCEIGKIITICEYLNDPIIMLALDKTIIALEDIFAKMDANPAVQAKTPAALKGKYKETHAAWFDTFFTAGFTHAQAKLQEYADNLKGRSDFGTLSADKQASILKVAKNPATYCDKKWVHP